MNILDDRAVIMSLTMDSLTWSEPCSLKLGEEAVVECYIVSQVEHVFYV
jgi:hypothetical protein